MAHRERSAEGSTRFTIVHVGVGEEDRVLGCEAASYVARLTDEGVVNLCAIYNGSAGLCYDILHYDVVADVYVSLRGRGQGAVHET